MDKYTHISFYKFVAIEEPELLKAQMQGMAENLDLMGTMIIAGEGINGMLAGHDTDIQDFIIEFQKDPRFSNISFKVARSQTQPFKKLLIKIKEEILTFNEKSVKPHVRTGNYLKPLELKKWLESKKEVVLLDTRNNFEVEQGTFKGALNPGISKFTEFKKAVGEKLMPLKEKTIVTFCTGGIRCEKATAYMLEKGFKDVWQVEGGILKYLEDTDGSFWEGQCFVFDNRISVDKELNEISSKNKKS